MSIETSYLVPTELKHKEKEEDIQIAWDNYKNCDICVTGIPQEKKKRIDLKKIFK